MKKLITAVVATALAFTATPTAAAQGSSVFGSSSSPTQIDPQPQPDPQPSISPQDVVRKLTDGYNQRFLNDGFQLSASAASLARTYSAASPSVKLVAAREAADKGIVIRTQSHITSNYLRDYENLMATPVRSQRLQAAGVHVEYGEHTTIVTYTYSL